MPYKVVEARQRPTEVYLKILVNPLAEQPYLEALAAFERDLKAWRVADPKTRGNAPTLPEDPRIYREFQWGLDVSPTAMCQETKLYLDAEFGVSSEAVLSMEGTNL